ncbi:hypothetical protein [Advenella incenata]|jgi:peptide/nickel transport system substrate-binding protein|uniref:hypothetical protein n=1 Tax=Advenella incenata TaxID=267800 RepID=UPI000FEC28B7|nr:hypothetical protein [Advenella incenata]
MATSGNPFSNGTFAANGRKAWAGWPDVPEIEALRSKFAFAADTEQSKRITEQIQKLVIDEGVARTTGQIRGPGSLQYDVERRSPFAHHGFLEYQKSRLI